MAELAVLYNFFIQARNLRHFYVSPLFGEFVCLLVYLFGFVPPNPQRLKQYICSAHGPQILQGPCYSYSYLKQVRGRPISAKAPIMICVYYLPKLSIALPSTQKLSSLTVSGSQELFPLLLLMFLNSELWVYFASYIRSTFPSQGSSSPIGCPI